jgi:hypothetical protein
LPLPFTSRLFLNKTSDVISHLALYVRCGTEVSLSLLILLAELVTALCVVHLYFTGSGNGKSFGRRFMCFDLSHFENSLSVTFIIIRPFGPL